MFGRKQDTKRLVATTVFFCLAGWVYSNPVAGAPPEGSAPPGVGAAPAIGAVDDGQGADAQAVAVSSLGAIDLHVKELDLSKVLQLLSIQAQRNIVAGPK